MEDSLSIDLSILVVSRNVKNLGKLFDSIKRQIDFTARFEILVSWNGFESTSFLLEKFGDYSSAKFFCRTPYHFAKNSNFLSLEAKGEFLLFLNDDIILDASCLERAYRRVKIQLMESLVLIYAIQMEDYNMRESTSMKNQRHTILKKERLGLMILVSSCQKLFQRLQALSFN